MLIILPCVSIALWARAQKRRVVEVELKKDIGRRCTLVLKRMDGKIDFQTGTFSGETDTHFRLLVDGKNDTLYLKTDVQKIEFETEAV